jgi:hypothetical protein
MPKSDKNKTSVTELTKGYEQFMQGKEVKKNAGKEFQKAIKKAATPKQRGSK